MTDAQALRDTVRINEVSAAPLSEYVKDFLKVHKKETPYLDFKLVINVAKDSNFPEIVKDILAFSNYGVGWILIGWREQKKNIFIPEGLPEDFQLDQATLQEKFNSYVSDPLELLYEEITENIEGVNRRFGFIYIPPSREKLTPIRDGTYTKDNGRQRTVFQKGELFYRRGTQSIRPSSTEVAILEKRLEKENYRISVLSGEPDEIEEELFGNIFNILKIPEYVYIGVENLYNNTTIKAILKEKGVFPYFYFKFKEWNNDVVTFENLTDPNNPYSSLIQNGTVQRELVNSWLEDRDKRRVIVELLNRELRHWAMAKKIFYDEDHDKLFYPMLEASGNRYEKWKTPYRQSKKSVVAKMYAEQLERWVYCHPAFKVAVVDLNGRFYMRILPTFAITEDGKKIISDPAIGSIITRLSYDKYNDSYLNTIRFWAQKLTKSAEDQTIKISDYLEISVTPCSTKLPFGILFDIPSKDFRLELEDSEGELPEDVASGERT